MAQLQTSARATRQRSSVSSDASNARVVLFAGGGSGGHLSPGLAVAERLTAADDHTRVLFACSERAIDARMLDAAGVSWQAIPAAGLSRSPLGVLRFVRSYAKGVRAATRLIQDQGVTDVVAMGGFVAAPVMRAARQCGVRTTLVNLDDPPGKANRMMARTSDRVLSTVDRPEHHTFADRVVPLPIRSQALAQGDSAVARRALGLDPNRATLLVTGASQGATSINRMMIAMVRDHGHLYEDWQVLHLSGQTMEGEVSRAYAEAGVSAVGMSFCDAMGDAWSSADLAISRSGANSVAEAHANAVPSLFLPYPYHRDMHQRRNAAPMVEAGGALVVEDRIDPDATLLAALPILRELMSDAESRAEMQSALRESAPGDGAEAIAQELLSRSTTC